MRTVEFACTKCGHRQTLDGALLFPCSECNVPSGQACVDLRYLHAKRYRPISRIHPARRALVDSAVAEARAALQSATLRSVS